MGLDLSVRVTKDFTTNKEGNRQWTVVELANLRNCWEFLEMLEMENCSTASFDGEFLNGLLECMSEEEQEKINELVKFDDDETYDIHCWY